MRKIILASNSPQRKKLLKVFGFPFKVHPSRAEELNTITTNCASLVKNNALLKARDVAKHYKDAVVIGSDTVVFVGNKVMIGKPKDLQEAKKNLKLLFTRPQWVYTGVAVIDTRTKQTILDYEKTKVFMSHLMDDEIDRYHKKVSPLDKAGGFDIEGYGSIFIRRIEGCYTNVIGLPVAKLANILRKLGVTVLSLVCLIWITGCSTEYNLATKQEETLLYGTEKEISIGDAISKKIEEEYKVIEDIDVNERVTKIMDRISAISDRKDVRYYIKVLDDDMINAVSLPGGYVYVFRGLIEKAKSDDELAGVIAHEVGHITAKHALKRLQLSYGALLLQFATVLTSNGRAASGVNFVLSSLFFEYSQRDEFQSDQLGVKYMKLSGYDPKAMITMLEILQKEGDKQPLRAFSYWRTHPHIPQRIAIVNKEINGTLEFGDYIKLIGRDE